MWLILRRVYGGGVTGEVTRDYIVTCRTVLPQAFRNFSKSLNVIVSVTVNSAGDVTRVELKRADGGFVLAKEGGNWTFQAPQKFRANGEKVESWLKSLPVLVQRLRICEDLCEEG